MRPTVINNGVITAKLGSVQLTSGDSFTVDMYGDGLMQVAVSNQVQSQLVANTGLIEADGGTVQLTAAAGSQIINSLITVAGEIKTPAVAQQNGEILIYAEGSNAVPGNVAANKGIKSGDSEVLVSGTLDATGYGAGQTGGSITVTGDHVGLLAGASIDASGDVGGGYVKIGGDFHGQGTTPNAEATLVQQGVTIKANAVTSGNGGNVAVWSDNYTNFAGTIEAMGAARSGNGGYVETSGKIDLQMSGLVNASAPNGISGTWLMDPEDVTISTGSDSDESGNPNFVPGNSQATAVINTSDIDTALNTGTNVTVSTSNNGQSGPNGGSITLATSSPISATIGTAGATGSLTLSSYNDISINSAITLGGTGVAGGAITLRADNAGNNSGYINVDGNITSNGGAITMGGGSGSITAGSLNSDGTLNTAATGFATGNSGQSYGIEIQGTVSSGAGAIIINGKGYAGSGGYGVYVTGNGDVQGTSGGISITGIGGSGTTGSQYGIALGGGVETTGIGTVTLTGTGGGSSSDSVGSDVGVYLNYLVSWYGSVASTASGGGAIYIYGAGGDIGGSGSSNNGIAINYHLSNVTTQDGNIVMYGKASNATGGYNFGISFANGGNPLSAIGSGSITLTGIGGSSNSNGSNEGIATGDGSALSTISTNTGNITINGTGGGSSSSINGGGGMVGIDDDETKIISTGGGSITVNGTGGKDAGGTNYGIWMEDGTDTITTTSGSITLDGVGGTGGSNDYGIKTTSNSGNKIGNTTTETGNITLEANTWSLATPHLALQTTGSGRGDIQPPSQNGTIGVNGDTGNLGVTSADLGIITAPNTIIGLSNGTGLISIDGANLSSDTFGNLQFINGSANIQFDGGATALTLAANKSFSENATSGSFVTATAAGTITTPGTGGITINNATTLGENLTLNAGSGGITFDSTINGADALVADSTGTTTFTGTVGGGTPLASISVDGTGNVAIDANVTTTGTQNYTGAVTLGNNDMLTTTNSNVTFGSTVNGTGSGAQSLTVSDGTGETTFNSTIGAGTPLANLTLTNDAVSFGGNIKGTGTFTLQPSTNATNIHINDGTSSGLYLTSTEQGYIQNDWAAVVFGNTSDTALMKVGASTWGSPVTFNNGGGSIEFSGAQTLGSNSLIADSTSGNIQLDSGATITSTATSGYPIILAASGGGFINNSGSGSPLVTGAGGHWAVYSTSASGDTNGASVMSPATTVYSTSYPTTTGESGNTWFYSSASGSVNEGTIDITATAQSYTYGTTLGALTFTCMQGGVACSGSILSDLAGAVGVVNENSSTVNAGTVLSHAGGFDVSSSPFAIVQNSLTWASGFTGTIDFTTANLTLTKKTLTDTGMVATSKTYDSTTTAAISNAGSLTGGGSTSGDGKYITGDTVSLTGNSGTFSSANVGTWTVTGSGVSLTGRAGRRLYARYPHRYRHHQPGEHHHQSQRPEPDLRLRRHQRGAGHHRL